MRATGKKNMSWGKRDQEGEKKTAQKHDTITEESPEASKTRRTDALSERIGDIKYSKGSTSLGGERGGRGGRHMRNQKAGGKRTCPLLMKGGGNRVQKKLARSK